VRKGILALSLVLFACPAATAGPLSDYAVFGGTSVNVHDAVPVGLTGSNGTVTVGFVNTPFGGLAGGTLNANGVTVNGPTTFSGDLNAVFATFNGPINTGGNVSFSSFTNTQNITAKGNVILGGGFSTTTGNVLAGGNFTLPTFGSVIGNVSANGSVTVQGVASVNGNVTFGTTLSNAGTITGTTTQGTVAVNPTPFTPVTLTADKFTSGGQNISAGAFSTTTLAPGSYGNVNINGAFSTLNLSAGDYFLNSLLLNGTTLNLDLTKGSINVFVTGDINLQGGSVFVNGLPAFINGVPNPAVQALAAQVFFESLGNIVNGSPFGIGFFGTLFAPDGNISTSFGPDIGSLIAGGDVSTGSFSPVFFVPSDRLNSQPQETIPEPGTLTLWGVAGLSLLGFRRLRWQAA
jgi:hypothetical protein